MIYCIRSAEQTNTEKDSLQKSVDELGEERKTEADKLQQELKQKLQTAAEQYETKLQAEINKGTRLRLLRRHSLLKPTFYCK